MDAAGSVTSRPPSPLMVQAELTYSCPLQCPYCYNGVDFAFHRDDLTTEQWLDALRQARALGAVQLGFTGGEPMLRPDLETLVREGRQLGYCITLLTSGMLMTEKRLQALKEAGLDGVQVAFPSSSPAECNFMSGTASFEQKRETARLVKKYGLSLVLNFVVYRDNIDKTEQMLELATELQADYVEFANCQFHGWGFLNRDRLMPTLEQLTRSEALVNRFREQHQGRMRVFYVIPDYYAGRPKPCLGGWGTILLAIGPDGAATPCPGARGMPGVELPNVRESSLDTIWYDSPVFNKFRGFEWMKEPCRSCEEKTKDFGGCRCQAYLLTGNPANADPTCSLSPYHGLVEAARAGSQTSTCARPYIFRNVKNSRRLCAD